MKKISVLLLLIILFSLFVPALSADAAYQVNFDVTADAAYLINVDTDQVVYEKNANKKIFPASVTKMMTVVLTLENIKNLDTEKIIVEPYMLDEFRDLGYGYSHAGLLQFEEFTASELVYALMVQSASDAANTLAAHIGEGSITAFVDMMNEKAKELGMNDTNFTNPHGLHNDNHYTTAYDLYLLTKYAMSLPGFMEYATTSSYKFSTNKRPDPQYLITTNWMQDYTRHPDYYYEYVKGIKTGTTDEAGSCLVSSAEKNGYSYILVLMGAPVYDQNGENYEKKQSFVQTKQFYEWAFDTFVIKDLVDEGEFGGEVPIKLAWDKDALLLKTKDSYSQLVPENTDATSVMKKANIPEYINAPIKEGDKVGTLDIYLMDEVVGSVDLYASESVDRSTPLYILEIIKSAMNSTWFKVGIGFIILFIIFFVIMFVTVNRRRNLKRQQQRLRRSQYKR